MSQAMDISGSAGDSAKCIRPTVDCRNRYILFRILLVREQPFAFDAVPLTVVNPVIKVWFELFGESVARDNLTAALTFGFNGCALI